MTDHRRRWLRDLPGVAGIIGALGLGASAWAVPSAQYPQVTLFALSEESSEEPAAVEAAAEADAAADEPLRVSMDFQDANLKDVLKVFSKQTGINVIARDDVGERTITLYLEEVTVLDALDQLLEAADLIYERAPGSQIYLVKPKPVKAADEESPTLETRIYRMRYARVSTSRLAKAAEELMAQTPFEGRQLVSVAGGASAAGSRGGGGGRAGGGGDEDEDVGIDVVMQELVTERGRVSVDSRTNSIIVTDVPENFPRIEAVMAALDVKTSQVMIEAEMLETTMQKAKDLGLKWGTKGNMLTVTPGIGSMAFPFDRVRGRKTFLTTAIDTSDSGGPIAFSGNFTAPGQFSFGLIDATQMTMVLQALAEDTDTKILARPKVLTLDNESAVIRMTTNQAIATETTATDLGAGVQTTSTERAVTGVILVVTPQVNDQQFITMLVEPTVARTVVSEIDPDIIDPKSRSVRTMVRVPSGSTLVLGGLVDHNQKDLVSSVPVMSGIPIIGEAFKHTSKSDAATELIVFITPTVLPEPGGAPRVAAASNASPEFREQEELPSRSSAMEEALQKLEQ